MKVMLAIDLRRVAAAAVGVMLVLLAGAARARAQGAALTEPRAQLERALECHGSLAGDGPPPVILVHGTGSTPEESFGFGYVTALPKRGIPACTVRLPGRALVDQQRSIQYVVHAVREVAHRSGRKVSLVGHSQGATLVTYATYLWPDLPAKVDDVVGLAGPYQGTTTADDSCADAKCPVFAWQFRRASKLNAAFHAARQPTGPSYTAIATAVDELVAPAPEAARLEGATNIVIQDVCALRPIDHYLLTGDAVTYALVLDALTHPGPADRSRFDSTTCLQTVLPGADLVQTAVTAPVAIANAITSIATAPEVDREPALRCPFDAADCPAPQVRLTRRCVPGGALRVALAGDLDAVRSADFKLGRRLVRRAAGAPFAATLAPRTLRRAGRSRLRAVASLGEPPGGRVILARPLPRCGT